MCVGTLLCEVRRLLCSRGSRVSDMNNIVGRRIFVMRSYSFGGWLLYILAMNLCAKIGDARSIPVTDDCRSRFFSFSF